MRWPGGMGVQSGVGGAACVACSWRPLLLCKERVLARAWRLVTSRWDCISSRPMCRSIVVVLVC
jgi:hypothetical protein